MTLRTILLSLVTVGWSSAPAAHGQAGPDQQTVPRFLDTVQAYVAQRDRLEKTVPSLPKEATPEQIDRHQRALAALIQSTRSAARPGDLFGKAMTTYLRSRLQQIFSSPEGPAMRAQILEEYPGPTPLTINGRYPDRVPLSNIPPPVFAVLPELPDAVEFRFVGPQLILFDSRANLVIDFIRNALPAR
jgi:hypothetical protein